MTDDEEESVESIENLDLDSDNEGNETFGLHLTPFDHIRSVTDLSEIVESPEEELCHALDHVSQDFNFSIDPPDMGDELSYSFQNGDVSDLEEEFSIAREEEGNQSNITVKRRTSAKKEVRFKNMNSNDYRTLARQVEESNQGGGPRVTVSITNSPDEVNIQVTIPRTDTPPRIDTSPKNRHQAQDSEMWILDDEDDEKTSAHFSQLDSVSPITPMTPMSPEIDSTVHKRNSSLFIAQSVSKDDDLEQFMVDIADDDLNAAILHARTSTAALLSGHLTPVLTPSMSKEESVSANADDLKQQFGMTKKQRIKATNMMSGDVRPNQNNWTFGVFCM